MTKTTVIFVHGTGIDQESYATHFIEVSKAIGSKWPHIEVKDGVWFKDWSDKSFRDTVPNYEFEEEQQEFTNLWLLLYENPFCELNMISHHSDQPQTTNPESTIDSKLNSLLLALSDELKLKLTQNRIKEKFFLQAIRAIIDYDEFQSENILANETYALIIARAIIAQTRELCLHEENNHPLLDNAYLRDELVADLAQLISIKTMSGWLDWTVDEVKNRLKKLKDDMINKVESEVITFYLKRNRSAKTFEYHRFIGDIMRYQGRYGDEIRSTITKKINECEGKVVVLAHSLGGIISTDTLIQNKTLQEKVSLFVTIGSQVPFLYALNGLYSLAKTPSEPFPEPFPKWINIYDPLDFFSYIGKEVFPCIQDFEVHNGQPFPLSHSAYFTNPKVWELIFEHFPSQNN